MSRWTLLAAVLVLSSCGARPAPAPPPPKVKVVQPVAREITEWDEFTARLDAARLDVEFTRVSAPIGGRVGRKLVTEGNLINGGVGTQGTLLTTIVSLDPIYAYFEADEASLLKYDRLARSGQRRSSRDYQNPVHVALAGEEGFPHDGVMDFVDNQLDRGTGTIVGRALLPNPDLSLIPGLFARLRLPGSGQYRAILLPDEAIGSDQSQKFVYLVDGESKAQYRTVKIGPLVDGLRVVREGVGPEDRVVVAGLQRVRPGLKVDAQEDPMPSPPAADAGGAHPATTPASKPSGEPQRSTSHASSSTGRSSPPSSRSSRSSWVAWPTGRCRSRSTPRSCRRRSWCRPRTPGRRPRSSRTRSRRRSSRRSTASRTCSTCRRRARPTAR